MREKQAADEGWPLYYSIPGFKWRLHMECGPCAVGFQVLTGGCGWGVAHFTIGVQLLSGGCHLKRPMTAAVSGPKKRSLGAMPLDKTCVVDCCKWQLSLKAFRQGHES